MALSKSETQKLKILGVIVVIMVGFNLYRKMGKSGGSTVTTTRAGQAAPSAGRRTAAASPSGGGASSARRSSSRALTPRDIPVLADETKRKLKALKNPKVDLISPDKILYETRNPFLPLQLTDKMVEQRKIEQERGAAGASGGAVAADILFFRGIMHIAGERFAVIERPDRKVPWFVREGERLEETDFVLQNIDEGEKVINLLDTKAKRDRDKIKTIPYSGLEEMAFADSLTEVPGAPPGPGRLGQGGPGGLGGPGGSQIERPESTREPVSAPSPDDFEIVE